MDNFHRLRKKILRRKVFPCNHYAPHKLLKSGLVCVTTSLQISCKHRKKKSFFSFFFSEIKKKKKKLKEKKIIPKKKKKKVTVYLFFFF